MNSRISWCQPTCLDLPSPAANSLRGRISRRRLLAKTCQAQLPIAYEAGYLVVSLLAQTCLDLIIYSAPSVVAISNHVFRERPYAHVCWRVLYRVTPRGRVCLRADPVLTTKIAQQRLHIKNSTTMIAYKRCLGSTRRYHMHFYFICVLFDSIRMVSDYNCYIMLAVVPYNI